MNEETVTVVGYFGKDKQVTREEFVKVWKEHISELRRLSWDDPRISEIIETVQEIASVEFDRLRAAQSK